MCTSAEDHLRIGRGRLETSTYRPRGNHIPRHERHALGGRLDQIRYREDEVLRRSILPQLPIYMRLNAQHFRQMLLGNGDRAL